MLYRLSVGFCMIPMSPMSPKRAFCLQSNLTTLECDYMQLWVILLQIWNLNGPMGQSQKGTKNNQWYTLRKKVLPNTFFGASDCLTNMKLYSWIPRNLSFRYIHCKGQFTPKMKANAKPRLLSFLVRIDSG